MVDRIRIHNWDKHQTYRRDRKQPPWIKIHRSLVFCPKWAALSDAQKGQMVSIWILAADRDGWIPSDPSVVRKLCGLDSPPDLDLFISLGLVGCDAKVTPDGRQSDAPEAESEAEAEAKGRGKNAPRKFQDSTEGDGTQINELVWHFIELRRANDPGATIPSIVMPWEAEMGRIHFADKRAYPQIREVMEYSQTDEFWMGNILTPRDLRTKFQQLVLNMKRGTGAATIANQAVGARAPVEFPEDPDLSESDKAASVEALKLIKRTADKKSISG